MATNERPFLDFIAREYVHTTNSDQYNMRSYMCLFQIFFLKQLDMHSLTPSFFPSTAWVMERKRAALLDPEVKA